jgi:hypothetical protein
MGSMSMRLGTQQMVACQLVQPKDRNVCFFVSKVFRANPILFQLNSLLSLLF